jgi:hypothetical protein
LKSAEYSGFQRAFDFFNRELFGGSLPQLLVTLQRHALAAGYFSPERFTGRIKGDQDPRIGTQPGRLHQLHGRGDPLDPGPRDGERVATDVRQAAAAWLP